MPDNGTTPNDLNLTLDHCAFWAIETMAFQQIRAQLEAAGQNPLRIEAAAGRTKRDAASLKVVDGIATIPIQGPIVRREGLLTQYFGFTASEGVERLAREAATDKAVKAVVLDVDSPGGSVSGLPEAADALYELRQQKPVVAQVSGMAASAALLLAAQASEIVAGRMDLIGSIGTILMLYDTSRLFENEGVKAIPVTTGQYKAAGAMGVPITEEQIAEFQKIVDGYFADFVASLVRGRGMTETAVRSVADGRVFFAQEAVTLGLIDGIATPDATIGRLRGQFARRAERQRMRNRLALDIACGS